MSEELKRFTFGSVDFDNPESVAAVYGSGGLWRHEEVTILRGCYFPDLFLKRTVRDKDPECGLLIEWHFHNEEIQATIAKKEPQNRHWSTSGRYGFGKFFLDRQGKLYKEDGSVLYKDTNSKSILYHPQGGNPIDFSTVADDDLRFDWFTHGPGGVWPNGSFNEFHQALAEVTKKIPANLEKEWKDRYNAGSASAAFGGLRCMLSQVDVEVDAKAREAGEKRIADAKKQMEAEGRPQADIDKLRWFPPTRIYIDEIIGFEDVDSLAAYDPNAVIVTERAIAFIKAKIESGVVKMSDIGMAALNEAQDMHPEVVAALDVGILAQHGINWSNQKLSLAG